MKIVSVNLVTPIMHVFAVYIKLYILIAKGENFDLRQT